MTQNRQKPWAKAHQNNNNNALQSLTRLAQDVKIKLTLSPLQEMRREMIFRTVL